MSLTSTCLSGSALLFVQASSSQKCTIGWMLCGYFCWGSPWHFRAAWSSRDPDFLVTDDIFNDLLIMLNLGSYVFSSPSWLVYIMCICCSFWRAFGGKLKACSAVMNPVTRESPAAAPSFMIPSHWHYLALKSSFIFYWICLCMDLLPGIG